MTFRNLALQLMGMLCLLGTTLHAQTTLGTLTTASPSCNFTTTNVCEGDIIELQPTDLTSFTNFKWYFGSVAPANEITGVNPTYHVVAKTGNTIRVVAPGGVYILTADYATPSGCAANNDIITVNFNTTPVLAITNPTAVCSPSTVDLTAASVTTGSTGGGVLTYWTDAGATTALTTPSAVTTSGTYYIKSTTASGCTDIEAVTVTVNTTPNLTIANPSDVCSPSTVDLTAPAVTAGSTGGGTLTYWTDAGATTAVTTPSAVTTSGTYYIKATTAAGCTDIEAVTVTVNTTPNLTIANPSDVCSPSTVDLTAPTVTAGSTGGGTLTYWTDAGATTALTTPSSVTSSGTYYIKATTASGCTNIEAVTVTVNTTPNLTIANPAAVCSPSTVDLTAPAVTAGSTGGGTLTYWTDAGATTAVTTPSAVTSSGTYYIKATTAAGCTDLEAVTVTVNATPDFTLTHPTVCPGDADLVNITALTNAVNATGSLTIDGGTATTPIPTSITGASAGNHTATIRNAEGCETTKNFTINPIVPKVCIPLTITKVN